MKEKVSVTMDSSPLSELDLYALIIILILSGFCILTIILIIKFWFEMLFDCIRRPLRRFPSRSKLEKLFWCLVILFGQLMGAVVYYLALKRNDPYYAFFEERTQ